MADPPGRSRLAFATVGAFLIGCRGAPDPTPDDPPRAVAGEPSGARALRPSAPRCDGAPGPDGPAVPRGAWTIEIVRGAGVSAARARDVRGAMTEFWIDWGVELRPGAVRDSPLPALFTTRLDAVERVRDDPKAVADLLYDTLRRVVSEHAVPRRPGVVVVVIVRDVVHPGSAAATVLGDLVGLTLSPDLLETGDDASAAVLEALDLGRDFTPTVLLSDRHLDRMTDVSFTAAVAHEAGHALGLGHDPDRANLMSVGRHDCTPVLRPEQLAQLGEGASIDPG